VEKKNTRFFYIIILCYHGYIIQWIVCSIFETIFFFVTKKFFFLILKKQSRNYVLLAYDSGFSATKSRPKVGLDLKLVFWTTFFFDKETDGNDKQCIATINKLMSLNDEIMASSSSKHGATA